MGVLQSQLRVVSLNLHAYPNPGRGQAAELAALIAAQRPDVLLLQECLGRAWFQTVAEITEMTGCFSHQAPPSSSSSPPDGCAILVRDPVRLENPRRIAPEGFSPAWLDQWVGPPPPLDPRPMPDRLLHRFSARSLLADLRVAGQHLTVGSFHATPGTGQVGGEHVGNRKTYFHAGVAAMSAVQTPFIFAIDANEPRRETLERIEFHWGDDTAEGVRAAALLGLRPRHPAEDLLRRSIRENNLEVPNGEFLELTYETKAGLAGAGRRFDSIWATAEFGTEKLTAIYEPVRKAGGDHAMLVADLALRVTSGGASP